MADPDAQACSKADRVRDGWRDTIWTRKAGPGAAPPADGCRYPGALVSVKHQPKLGLDLGPQPQACIRKEVNTKRRFQDIERAQEGQQYDHQHSE